MLRRLKKRKVDVAAGRTRGLATGHNAESYYYLITAGKAIFFIIIILAAIGHFITE